MVNYIFPSVQSKLELERQCPHCHRFGGNRHSSIRHRAISDIRVDAVAQQRMKCPYCATTWTIRVQGVGHGRQRSDRLIAMGVFLYMLGLSYRAVRTFLLAFEWKGSKSSIERDVARSGRKAKALHMQAPAMQVRILGVDGTGAKMAGQKAGLLFFVDIERQRLLSVEPIKETDTRRVSRDPIDGTNNTTERIIGLTYKIRAKRCVASRAHGRFYLIRIWPSSSAEPTESAISGRLSEP